MSTQADGDMLKDLPTLRPFTQQLAAQLTSFDPPAAIYIHAPTNISLVTPIITRILDTAQLSYSHAATGDSPTVQQLLPKIAVIDLEEVHSTRQAFDRILNQLSGWTGDISDNAWDSQSHKLLNWDGRTQGLSVVKRAEKRRRSQDAGGPARKKRKSRNTNTDVEESKESDREGSVGQVDDSTVSVPETWQLSWDRAADASGSDFEPLRDTIEHFHYSLSKITALGNEDEAPVPDMTEETVNRWIVINHADMLNELSVTGTSSGASKETGLGMTLLGALLRTRELSRLPVSIILVSSFGFTKARDGLVGVIEPFILDFPDLSRAVTGSSDDTGWNDTLSILTARFAQDPPTSSLLSREQVIELFQSLAKVVWNVFSKWATDIDSIAYLVAKFWPKWLECVESSNPPIAYTNEAALHSHLKADFNKERDLIAGSRTSLDRPLAEQHNSQSSSTTSTQRSAPAMHGFAGLMPSLPKPIRYLSTPGSPGTSTAVDVFGSSPIRSLSRVEDSDDGPDTPIRDRSINITPTSSAQNSPGKAHQLAVAHRSDQTLAKSLPVISRYLLLASYYASFNPAKSDVRCFVRVDESVARKGKKGRRLAAPKPGSPSKGKLSSDLAGGTNFPLERLLAIFEAIFDHADEQVAQSSDVLMQITTLFNLRLLHRASAADKLLDNVKLGCRVSKDTVDVLAKSVGMSEWRQFLYDPDA